MKIKTGHTNQRFRIISQLLFLTLFFLLLIHSGQSNTQSFPFTDSFFYIDPLIFLLHFLTTGVILPLFLLSLIPITLTLIFGRFFCGWVCPFGSINQFFTWLFRQARKNRKEKGVNKPLLKLKYAILIAIIIAAIMGTHFGGWLDPFSLLTRTSTTVINPSINYSIHQITKPGANDSGIIAKTFKPLYHFARANILTEKQRSFSQPFLIGGIFIAILLLNLYRRRFYCNYICPLGALYGLISKFSFFNLKPNSSCISCKACNKTCTYNGSPFEDYMKSECLTCFNCINDCPKDAIDIKIGLPKKENRTRIDLGRRRLIGSTITGMTLAALPGIFIHKKTKIHRFCRPPGSIKEKDFLAQCIRCGQCMQVCPTNFIQPALLQAGVEGIWTPILNAQSGYCEYECNKCTQVCPTRAIEKITLKQKKEFKIGTAVIDRNRCYTYADGYNCAVCEEHCPVPEKAIRFREVDTWNLDGELTKVNQIYILPDLCIGCGICENVCPRGDSPGIVMSAEEESREFQY